jgi:hypothetical protein
MTPHPPLLLLTDPRTAQTVSEKKLIPYITIFLRKLPILLQNLSPIFIVKILIDLKKKTNKHPRFTIKFNANLEIASRQLFGTHGHFVHCAQ